VRRALFGVVLLFSLVGCRAEFTEEVDPLVGTWNLLSVEGLGCTVTDGDMSISQDAAGLLTGSFDWAADCAEGENVDESSVVDGVEIDVAGRDYGLDVRVTDPSERLYDWDCVMTGDALDCTETGGDQILIFEFQRETT
jgi:hypothetical protein